MSQTQTLPISTRRSLGWLGAALFGLAYAGLYALNYWLPPGSSGYTSRLWSWSQLGLAILALIVVFVQRRRLAARPALLGLGLALLSGLSGWLDVPALPASLQEGLAVWACFTAGWLLFQEPQARSIAAFQPPPASIVRSLLLGVLLATPLAALNNLFFYLTEGAVQWQNAFYSAFEALSPAIHEEVIYRFFVIAVVLRLLRDSASPRLALGIALAFAVFPHSLNHLPELFLDNPPMGLIMLALTSLLFGLPMALLQVKKNLEAAIAFHWFIDFARFLFGF